MREQPVIEETVGRVGVITLNRPQQMNALNDALMDALGDALLRFDADDGIGAIVITGNARAFAAGADIAAMSHWSHMDVYRGDFITRNWETIRRVRKPVIAAVAGVALGGGCKLALACDIVIAADDASFGLPEIKLAMMPGAGGTQRMPRAVGKAKAMDMCLSARTLNAAEAERSGLVSRVVPADALGGESMALAATIAGYSLSALMAIKESVNRAYEASLTEGVLFERRQLHARFASEDAHEGMAAFLEKRKRRFSGTADQAAGRASASTSWACGTAWRAVSRRSSPPLSGFARLRYLRPQAVTGSARRLRRSSRTRTTLPHSCPDARVRTACRWSRRRRDS